MSIALADFLQTLPAPRRQEALQLILLFERVTGETAALHHPSIVGFGHYAYRYPSGHSGTAAAAGFAPRSSAISIYLSDGVERHAGLLAALGPHTAGVGCLYVKRLADIDLGVLEEIVDRSYRLLTAETYGAPRGGR
ncbi:DUF1801 domain-containing protein [Leifsonia sp. LS-T14]|uniref:DUF1801 domain-containing protein n=1 Tax=unclassified Leifsonia TaxID=2663824 RepID=UPI0035A64C6A